jgi:hypothetical protein
MTIAELHGKISSTGRNLHDQMEDLLTSDVFTACKYLRLRIPMKMDTCSNRWWTLVPVDDRHLLQSMVISGTG